MLPTSELKEIVGCEAGGGDEQDPHHQPVEELLLIQAINGWERTSSDSPISPEAFPLDYREAWLQLFIRYIFWTRMT